MAVKSIKYCGGCCKTKLLRDFYSHADTYDGKQSQCRECRNKKNLERYYRIKKEKAKE